MLPIYLMDGSSRAVKLSSGNNTTVYQLHLQMMRVRLTSNPISTHEKYAAAFDSVIFMFSSRSRRFSNFRNESRNTSPSGSVRATCSSNSSRSTNRSNTSTSGSRTSSRSMSIKNRAATIRLSSSGVAMSSRC